MVKRSRCGSYHLVRPPVAIVADDSLHVLNRKVEGTVRRLLVDNEVGAIFQYGCHFDTEREDRDGLLGLDRGPLYTYLQKGRPLLTEREGGLDPSCAHCAETRIGPSARCFSCFSGSIQRRRESRSCLAIP